MRKKLFIFMALIAAIFMLPILTLPARAEPDELPDGEAITSEQLNPVEYPELAETTIITEIPLISIDEYPPMDFPTMNFPVTDFPETPPQPFTPAGTGTVVDQATDSDGKEFYTITTPNENVFYLVIDRQRSQENVYFLNSVTEADLISLAEMPETPVPALGTTVPIQEPVEPELEQEIESPPSSEKGGVNIGMIILIVAVVIIGGGVGWYLKIYRPKQQGAGGEDEYEPIIDDVDSDYNDEWDDDQDDIDDNPPWDVEETDNEDNDEGGAD